MGLSDRHSWASATPLTGSSDRHSRAQATATHGLKRPPLTGSSDRHSRAQATATHGLTGAGSWVAFATCSARRKDTMHTQYLFCAGRDSLSERRRALRLDGSHGRSVAWAEASHGPKRRMGRTRRWRVV